MLHKREDVATRRASKGHGGFTDIIFVRCWEEGRGLLVEGLSEWFRGDPRGSDKGGVAEETRAFLRLSIPGPTGLGRPDQEKKCSGKVECGALSG